jgi:hypothetical protein
MKISGLFSAAERESAANSGAIIEPTRDGYTLKFATEQAFRDWLAGQQRSHPSRWQYKILQPR